jgi:hypothetical protein
MGFFKIYFAKMFDEKGEHIKDIQIKKFSKIFNFENKSYNIKLKNSSHFDTKGIFWDRRFFIYNISNPDPIILDKKAEPKIEPELYNIMLETETAKKLNNLSKKGFKDLLTLKNLLIASAIIVGIYLFSTGKLIPN